MLAAVRRAGISAGSKFARTPARCSMSTFNEREKGAEAKFIREQEAKRAAELRAKMEKILALEDGHSDKAELVAILGNIFVILDCSNLNYYIFGQ